jgi:hypothetical protein
MILEHLQRCSVCETAKNVSHIQVLITFFFPTPPIKLKLRLQIGRRSVIASHLDQSNYVANQKEGEINKYDLTVNFPGSQQSSS